MLLLDINQILKADDSIKMKIQEEIKKCVVFIGLQMADGTYKLAGTGFFISKDFSDNRISWLVTAKHVIEGIKDKGVDVFIRANTKNGISEWFPTITIEWIYHKDDNVDIAIYPCQWIEDWDHMTYPIMASVTEEHIDIYKIGVGDEIFITGLFHHHHGKQKNIPIVRIGNIGAMPEEKIQTASHLMDGYLVEARSIGGLSGSPVFVNLSSSRDGHLLIDTSKELKTPYANLLMGIVYGHYDEKRVLTNEVESDSENNNEFEKINTGIAIVTPVDKIIELLEERAPFLKPITKEYISVPPII